MKIVNKKTVELKPYKNNPRRNDTAVEYVANSIREFGFKVPVVIDKNNVIVAGHTRVKAAKELGIDYIPCVVADDLTEEQIKAFRLADNKTAEFSEWDFDLLHFEIDDICDIDMEQFGFDMDAEDDQQEITRNEINYNENISVVVECEDELRAEEIFYKLTEEGYKCRISTL